MWPMSFCIAGPWTWAFHQSSSSSTSTRGASQTSATAASMLTTSPTVTCRASRSSSSSLIRSSPCLRLIGRWENTYVYGFELGPWFGCALRRQARIMWVFWTVTSFRPWTDCRPSMMKMVMLRKQRHGWYWQLSDYIIMTKKKEW